MDIFMERYGMTPQEFLAIPLPIFFALRTEIIRKNKEQKK